MSEDQVYSGTGTKKDPIRIDGACTLTHGGKRIKIVVDGLKSPITMQSIKPGEASVTKTLYFKPEGKRCKMVISFTVPAPDMDELETAMGRGKGKGGGHKSQKYRNSRHPRDHRHTAPSH